MKPTDTTSAPGLLRWRSLRRVGRDRRNEMVYDKGCGVYLQSAQLAVTKRQCTQATHRLASAFSSCAEQGWLQPRSITYETPRPTESKAHGQINLTRSKDELNWRDAQRWTRTKKNGRSSPTAILRRRCPSSRISVSSKYADAFVTSHLKEQRGARLKRN